MHQVSDCVFLSILKTSVAILPAKAGSKSKMKLFSAGLWGAEKTKCHDIQVTPYDMEKLTRSNHDDLLEVQYLHLT